MNPHFDILLFPLGAFSEALWSLYPGLFMTM